MTGRVRVNRVRMWLRRPFCHHGNTSTMTDDGVRVWKCLDCGKAEVGGWFFEKAAR